jgi:4-amino-4-deoxy-L-arabinose transferase-like glycosyltransferase
LITLALFTICIVKKDILKAHKNELVLFTLIGILILSLLLRLDKLIAFENRSLDPDAISYRLIALKSESFYDTNVREPLFVMLIKIFINFFGKNETTLRFLTVFLSLLLILVVHITGKHLFGNELIGMLSAFFAGINDNLIFMSVRLLRLELYVITILILFYLLFIKQGESYSRFVLIGISGGLICLTRITSLSFVFPFVFFVFWREKLSYTKMIIPISIIIVMVLPHFMHNKKKYGSYTYSIDIHATWYRNQEFKDKPGFASTKELEKNSYKGGPISSFEYIFGMHSLKTVVVRSIRGFIEIFFGKYLKYYFSRNDFMVLCLYAGLLMIMFTKYRFLWGIMVLLIGPTFFLAGTITIDSRLIAHIYPFMVFITIFSMLTISRTIWQKLQLYGPTDTFLKKLRLFKPRFFNIF